MFAKLVLLLVGAAQAIMDKGILKLDNFTFDRIIDGHYNVFVRFDKEYSYGDESDAWKDMAKTVSGSSADVLITDVGVSEYGDKDNSDLAERYSIKTDDFPQYRLWTKGSGSSATPVSYSGEKKADGFIAFLQEKAGIWIGLPGQVKELDAVAKEFTKATGTKEDVIAEAKTLVEKLDAADAESGKYYVKVMTKVMADSGFVGKEVARLKKMMDDPAVRPNKKEGFSKRLNMLASFA